MLPQRHSLYPDTLKIAQFNLSHQSLKYVSFIEEYIILSDIALFAQFGYNPMYFIYYCIIVKYMSHLKNQSLGTPGWLSP